jgi:hypothetical protein
MSSMSDPTEVPAELVDAVRAICSALPEVVEEPAWTGTRWCVRKKNFAHLVFIANGWPPAYAQAAGSEGPVTVLTFRSPHASRDAPTFRAPPYFKPVWFADIVGMRLDALTDWPTVADLVTESYCVLAPKQLVAMIDRPPA